MLLICNVNCLLVAGKFDFSGASVGSLSGIIMALGVSRWGIHWAWTIAISIGIAIVVGLIVAFLVNELKQPSFIASIAMSTILTAIMTVISMDKTGASGSIKFVSSAIEQIGDFRVYQEITAAAVVMVLFYIAYGLALSKTKFGRTLYLMGGNRAATRLAGIHPRKMSYFLFINGAVLGCLAGIVNASRTLIGSSAALSSLQFTGMTSAILGGISFSGGTGGMGGAFVGLMVINTFNTGITTSRGSSCLTQVLSGVLLMAALTFDHLSIRAQNRRIGA